MVLDIVIGAFNYGMITGDLAIGVRMGAPDLETFSSSVSRLVENPSEETARQANLAAILVDDFLMEESWELIWTNTRYFTQFLADAYRCFQAMQPLRERNHYVDHYAHLIAERYQKFTSLFDKGKINGYKIEFEPADFETCLNRK